METRELWDHSAKLISFVSDGDDVRTDINMPSLTKEWGWRKTAGCYHIATYTSGERLLASIGVKIDEENICIERSTSPVAYKYGAVEYIYTVYLRTNYRKYKIAEYVKVAERPLYYLTKLWRLSIGNIPYWAPHISGTRVRILSTQLMDLRDRGYRHLFCSAKDCEPHDVVRKSRMPIRYNEGVEEDGGFTVSDLKMFFPDVVWKVVAVLTRGKTTPREKYIEAVSKNYLAARVKVYDLEDNIDLGRIPNPTQKDYDRRDRYLSEYRKLRDAIIDWEKRLPANELETDFYAEYYC